MKIAAIHNKILREKMLILEKEIRSQAPKIQKEAMIQEFLESVKTFKFSERLRLAWRLLWGKL